MRRKLVKLVSALLTFLIGCSITAFRIYRDSPDSNVSVEDTLEISQVFHAPEDKKCDGQVEIVYESSLEGVDALDAIFAVANNSCEMIYYFGHSQTNNQNSWIRQNGKVKYIELIRDVEILERQLKPGEKTWFWIPAPLNKKAFEAGFTIRIGDERREKMLSVKVDKQLGQSGQLLKF